MLGFNHLPWYTAKAGEQSDVMNAASAILSAAAFSSRPTKNVRSASIHIHSDDEDIELDAASEFDITDVDGEVDSTAQSLAVGKKIAPGQPTVLPPVARAPSRPSTVGGRSTPGGTRQTNSELNQLAALRAKRAQENTVPTSITQFRMNYNQKQAQQKINVIKMLKGAVRSKRQMYGQSLSEMGDIFKAVDKDGGGTIDITEFRDGINRLGFGLSEPQIQEMIAVFDEDGNGEIEYKEFMDLVNTPIVDVSAIARVEWMSAREKIIKDENALKQQAYAAAMREANEATKALEAYAAEKLVQLKKAKQFKEEQLAREKREKLREEKRASRDGMVRRKQLRVEREERRLKVLLPVLESRREHRELSKKEWHLVQADESVRHRERQQQAWERGTALVRRQTMGRAQRHAERSINEKWNQTLNASLRTVQRQPSVYDERPRSVATM
jgi:hypothetical protein